MKKEKRRHKSGSNGNGNKTKTAPFNNPFVAHRKDLKQKLEAQHATPTAPREDVVARESPQPPRPESRPTPQDEDDFARLMSGLEPLNADPRGQWRPERPPPTADNLPLHDEETDVYEALLDLVDGRTHFDIEDSDEFIEGAIEGLDRRIVSKLRRGAYAIKAHLDLHGLTREDARDAVERFLAECQFANQRAVLIVHGRGLNSQDNIPVLKGLLRSWLERGRIAKRVLAFATARPHDGGAGAVYVLLRRMRTER